MARPVADVLMSFGARPQSAIEGEDAGPTDTTSFDGENAIEARELAIQAARDEGRAEGCASAAVAHIAALDAERSASDSRIVAERDRWARDEGHALGEKVAVALVELEARIASHTARILRGFLPDRLIDRAIEELAEHIRTILSGADGKIVEVQGPGDLVAALRKKLEGESSAIEFRPAASADVRIVCDDILVESRLTMWLDRLASAAE